MSLFINLLIAFSIIGIQYYLSTRRMAFWGALLPGAYLLFLVYFKFSETFDSSDDKNYWFMALFGMAVLLSGWISGRDSLEKKRKKELEKMQSHDMK